MLGNFWELQWMMTKMKQLQEKLDRTLIKSKEDWIIVEFTASWNIMNVDFEDESIIWDKERLKKAILTAVDKWLKKWKEVTEQKTQEIVWVDLSNMGSMLWLWK